MPVPGAVRRINIEATLLGGEIMVHTLHCKMSVNGVDFLGDPTSLQEQANFVRDKWGTSFMNWTTNPWAPKVSASTSYTRVVVYQLTAGGGVSDSREALFSPAVVGTGVGLMPSSSAIVASLKTSKPGRSFRGRMYLGGLAPSTLDTVTGRVSSATTTILAAAMANFITTLNGQDGSTFGDPQVQVGVLSKVKTLITPIETVIVDNVFDVQTRRADALVPAKVSSPVTNLA